MDDDDDEKKRKKQLSYIQQHAMVIIFQCLLALLRFRLSEFLYFLCHMHDDFEISGKGIYHKKCSIQRSFISHSFFLSYIYFTISFFLLYFLGHVFEITRTIFHFQESLQISLFFSTTTTSFRFWEKK